MMDSIRGAGLLVCVITSTSSTVRDSDFDAVLRGGLIQYIDHSTRELV